MLRLGSAFLGENPLAVAGNGNEEEFVNLSQLCGDLGRLESLDDLLEQCDVIVDTTPKHVAAGNLPRYQAAGVKAIV